MEALESPAFYVGAIGSRRNTALRLQRLSEHFGLGDAQLARLRGRDGIDETLARQMMAAQLPREQRLKAAHDTILNTALPADTLAQVERLHRTYLQLAAAR